MHVYFWKIRKKRKNHPRPAPVRRRPVWTSSSRGSASPRPRASWAARLAACRSWPASRALPRELLADAPRVLCLGPRVLPLAQLSLPCARTEGRKGKTRGVTKLQIQITSSNHNNSKRNSSYKCITLRINRSKKKVCQKIEYSSWER